MMSNILDRISSFVKANVYYCFGFFLVLIFFVPHLLFRLNFGGADDWNHFEALDAIARYFLLTFKTLPLWDPYRCGGYPFLVNPEVRIFSPFYILTLIFGVAAGLKLSVLINFVLGYYFFYKFIKSYQLSEEACVFSAMAFALNGYWVAHMGVGHWGWVAVAYIPYFLKFYRDVWIENKKFTGLSIFMFYLLFSVGGPYILIFTFIISFIINISYLIITRDLKKVVQVVIPSSLAIIMALPTLYPPATYLSEHTRDINPIESNNIFNILSTLFIPLDRTTKLGFGMHRNHEYFAYIGYIPVILTLGYFAYFKKMTIKSYEFIFLMIFGLLMTTGNFGTFSPFNLLHDLPLMRNIRGPSRFILFAIISISLFSGFFLNYLLKKFKTLKDFFPLFLILYFIIMLPNAFYYNSTWIQGKDISAFNNLKNTNNFTQSYDRKYFLNKERILSPNVGVLNCSRSFPIKFGELRSGPLLIPGMAEIVSWSPNLINLKIISKNPVQLNSNCDDHWVSDQADISCKNGLITIENPQNQIVSVKYERPDYVRVFLISFITMLLTICYYIWKSIKSHRHFSKS